MRDPRVTDLARILVEHSTAVKEGDVCTIEGESAAEPLLQAVYEEVLRAGGNPIVHMALEGQPPPTSSTPPTSSSSGSRRRRSGRSRTPTSGSR